MVCNNAGTDACLSQKSIDIAAQCWCDPRVSDRIMDVVLGTVFAEQIEKYRAALVWCSAANEFNPEDGIARKGYEKIVRPLL